MKKILSILMSCTLLIGSFTGCSSPKNPPAEQKSSQKAQDTNEKPTNQEVQPSDKQVIKIFHHMSEEGKRSGLQAMADAVSQKYPEISFEIQGIDFTQYATMLKTKIASGDAPDIIFGRPGMYADMIQAGHMMDLSNESFVNNISETATASMKIDGKVYGVALDLQTMGLFYNKDVFEKNGISVPTTYTDLIKAADEFVAKGIPPFAHGFKDAWTAQVDFQSDFYGKPLSNVPTIYEDIALGTKKFSDFEVFKESLTRYAKRISYSSGDDFGTDASRAVQMFATGKAAMLAQGGWSISEIRTASPEGNFGFMVNPTEDNEKDNLLPISVDDAFMVSAQTEVKEGIIKFFDYVTSPEGAKVWVDHSKTISVIKGVGTDNLDPMAADILKYISAGQTYNFESQAVFSGQQDATFRKFQEEFAADPKRDVEKYIAKIDKDFEGIQQ